MAPGPNVCGDQGQVERKTSEVGGPFRVVPSSPLKRLKLRSGAKLTQLTKISQVSDATSYGCFYWTKLSILFF